MIFDERGDKVIITQKVSVVIEGFAEVADLFSRTKSASETMWMQH